MIGALCLATDLGMGFPFEHGLHTTLVASRLLETIHKHNVLAERHGLFGELRREVNLGERAPHHVTKREWLEDVPSPGKP